MRKYTRLFSVLILSVFALGFISCSDVDSLSRYWTEIVTVNEIGENRYDLTLDNGEKLWIASPEGGANLKPKYDRAIIYYTLLSEKPNGYDYAIELYRFYDVLTKGAIYIADDDKVKQDSIGNNSIKVHSMWEAGNYLNISFGYNAGGKEAHMLNLVSNKPDLSVDEDLVKLEFRHNQKGDPQNYPADGYVSFDLTPYKKSGRDVVTFEITWKDFGGQIKSKKIEYKYNDTGTPPETESLINNYDTNLNIY